MDNDLKLLITGQLNVGKTIGDINAQLKGIEKKINKLKLRVEIDEKILSTMNRFSEQMKRIQGDALQFGKRMEEVSLPDDTKVKTTSFDNLGESLDDVIVKAKNAANISKQLGDDTSDANNKAKNAVNDFTDSLDSNYKKAQEVTKENARGNKTYQDTYKNIKEAKTQMISYNEEGQKLQVITKKSHEQEEKLTKQRIDGIKKIAQERAKLRRELTGMNQDGTISNSQFNDLSSRLVNAKNATDLDRYKESMRNLVAETNKASTSQSKLNQAQGQFKVNLDKLVSQGKITEQQMKQFSEAVNTTKSVGQVKKLSNEIDKLKAKVSKTTTGTLMSEFDLDLEKRKFDNKVSDTLRQYPSIDKQAIGEIQKNFHALGTTTDGLRDKIRHYNMSLNETVTNTKRVTANTNTLAGAFQNAMVKILPSNVVTY